MIKYSERLEEIKNLLNDDEIKVVSFDLFDTLVLRPCLEPSDLFRLVPKRADYKGEFVQTRKIAEQYARKKKLYYYDDITLEEIYREFQEITNISDEEVKELMKCELDIEYEFIYPRKYATDLFYFAKLLGKRILIVTDVYFPKSFIEKLLLKNGLSDYDKLYVSSEERLSKGTGRLFQKVIKEHEHMGISKESIMHMGDNKRADVDTPIRLGMRGVHLPNAGSILKSKKPLGSICQYSSRTDNRFLVGALANYLFEDPFFPMNINSFADGKAKLVGAVLFGPMLLAYIKWLIEESKADNIQKILFVQRDGYLMEKIYSIIQRAYKTVPEADSVYLSRKIRYFYYGKEKTGLLNSFDSFEVPPTMTVNEFIEKRLLVTGEEKDNVWRIFKKYGYPDIDSPMGEPINYYIMINELQKYLEENTADEIKIIENYCRSKTQSAGVVGIVDVGYQGSVSRFLSDNFGIQNIGYQMLATPKVKFGLKPEYNLKTFISYSFKKRHDLKILHHLIEDILSVQDGTAVKIEQKNENYKVVKEDRKQYSEIIEQMQEGIMEYVEYAFEHLEGAFSSLEFDVSLFSDLLFDFLQSPNLIDGEVIGKLSFEESGFIKISTDENIYEKWYTERVASKKIQKKRDSQTNVEEYISEDQNKELQPWEKISKPHLYAIKVCEKLQIIDYAIQVKRKLLAKKYAKKKNEEGIRAIFENPLKESLKKVIQLNNQLPKKDATVLFAGHLLSFDKGVCNYIDRLSRSVTNKNFLLMSECSWINEENSKKKISIPVFVVPEFLGKNRYLKNLDFYCEKEVKKYVNNISYLKWGVSNLLQCYEDMEESYAYIMMYYAEKYINKVLNILQPQYVVLWNEFFALHHVLKMVCKKRGIEVIYFEFGSLPGTLSIEKLGQMGESFPGKYADEFKKFHVTDEEQKLAENLINRLKKSKMNRNVQPINNDLETIKAQLNPERPTILYAGVNDYESGLVPYDSNTKESHSPIFKTSEEAVEVLVNYAKKHNCNFIYKPHPLIANKIHWNEVNNNDGIIFAPTVDINDVIDISTVVVTILSQVSYISLIRNKPVLMLGYTQLRGKDCCYEAFEKKEIEKSLTMAVNNGYTKEMEKAFFVHTAQMLKYNLFDDLQVKEVSYGQDIDHAVKYIFDCDNTVEWYKKI